jgi:sec-independent protein translocase protein TatA
VHFVQPAEIFGVDGIIILVVVVVVLFGSTQIPKLARSLGSAQKEFKKGLDEGGQDDTHAAAATPVVPVAPVVVAPPAQPAPPVQPVPPAGNGSGGVPS